MHGILLACYCIKVMKTINKYYKLTKPGIIRGNLITAAAGFFLASNGDIDIWVLLALLVGVALVIGSGCVFNNYLDKEIDSKMDRTKNRSLVTGDISDKNALIFGTILGSVGIIILAAFTNLLTACLGLLGLLFYVVIYGYYKRKSVYGTLVGSISGAIPPVAGYTAVTGNLDLGALLLFIILACWQMPHFYAIAIYRRNDYKAASIPVLSVVSGVEMTKKHIVGYIVGFIFAIIALYVFNYAGISYLLIMLCAGIWWLYVGAKGAKAVDSMKWAHSVFGVSLVVLLVFSVMISLNSILP